MQVGALRERNRDLDLEVEQLQAVRAQTQAELQALREQKARLGEELGRAKSGAFGWVRKLFS